MPLNDQVTNVFAAKNVPFLHPFSQTTLPRRVGFTLLISEVEDGETSLWTCCHENIVALVRSLRIGYVLRGGIVFYPALVGIVELPQRLQSRGITNGVEHRNIAALGRRVIHNRYARVNTVNKRVA